MSTQEKIGQVIKGLRIKKGLSQEQMSVLCGIDQHYISNIESGQRNLSVDIVERAASFFDLKLSEFFALVEDVKDVPDQLSPEVSNDSLQQEFARFMKAQNLSERTIGKYSTDTPNSPAVQRIIKSVTGVTSNMYRVRDGETLQKIIEKVAASDFDMIGHSMYSAGLKKYKLFIESYSSR